MSSFRAMVVGMLLVAAVRHGKTRGFRLIDLDEASAGRAVNLAVGEEIRVTLAEAGGTGYRWRVGKKCERLLNLKSEKREAGSGIPGAPGRHLWVFVGQSEGGCELLFESARSWEKTVTGKVILFPITVREGGGGKANTGFVRE